MKIIDFDDELRREKETIYKLGQELKPMKEEIDADSVEIKKIKEELAMLSEKLKIELPTLNREEKKSSGWDNQFFLNEDWIGLDKKIKDEVFRQPKLLPDLDKTDWIIVGIAGAIATILDFLVVRIPKDMNYLRQYEQKGSGFTEWLKGFGIDDEGNLSPFLKWCEDRCKVPYDQSVIKEAGVYPRNHRLRSLGHDPLFGLIFGIFDIWNGSIIYFDKNGILQVAKTFQTGVGDKIFAPFLWLGHLISDACTKQGLPIPGWGFLQILRFGSFGSKDRTIAEISEWMYLKGYDLRHFITMSIVPATIEIIVRAYHILYQLQDKNSVFNPGELKADKEIKLIQYNLKLHKMLLLAHGFAASGNAFKVWAYQGNPTAINISQWMMLIKESIIMLTAVNRNTTSDKLIRNRKKINITWDELRSIEIGKSFKSK